MHAARFHLLEIQNRQNQPNEIRVQAAGGWGSPVLGAEVAGSVTGRWSHACTCPSKWTLKICAQPFM